jgi:hypothetical protein
MQRHRRMAAWWLSRPKGYPIQKGWYRGSKVEGSVKILSIKILSILFMYTRKSNTDDNVDHSLI